MPFLRFLAFGFALLAMPAWADSIARQGEDSVRITDKPCPITETIVDHVPQGARGYLRLARAHFQGQDFTACWAPSEGRVWLWYEDGDQGIIPLHDFKEAQDI